MKKLSIIFSALFISLCVSCSENNKESKENDETKIHKSLTGIWYYEQIDKEWGECYQFNSDETGKFIGYYNYGGVNDLGSHSITWSIDGNLICIKYDGKDETNNCLPFQFAEGNNVLVIKAINFKRTDVFPNWELKNMEYTTTQEAIKVLHDFNPVGCIVQFWGEMDSIQREYYQLCDGGRVKFNSTYNNEEYRKINEILWKLLNDGSDFDEGREYETPDLRGLFLV
jgi:hypothetical protein